MSQAIAAGLDVLRARVALRERALVDVLDLAFRFVVLHGHAYARVGAATLLPALALSRLAAWALGWTVGWGVAALLAMVAQVPFTLLASRLVFQDDVSVSEVLRSALSDTPRIVVMRLVALPLLALATLFMVVPALWLATALYFMNEVMLLERASLGQAFGRAQRVSSNGASDTVLGLLLGGLVVAAGIVLADVGGRTIIEELFQFRPPPSAWDEGGSSLALVGLFAAVPYVATARFLTYLNVRTRAEGWDVQTRFAAIASRTEAP